MGNAKGISRIKCCFGCLKAPAGPDSVVGIDAALTFRRRGRRSSSASAGGLVRGEGRAGSHILLAHKDPEGAMGAARRRDGCSIASLSVFAVTPKSACKAAGELLPGQHNGIGASVRRVEVADSMSCMYNWTAGSSSESVPSQSCFMSACLVQKQHCTVHEVGVDTRNVQIAKSAAWRTDEAKQTTLETFTLRTDEAKHVAHR